MVENLMDDSPKDACGLLGVCAPGQESAGIAASAGDRIAVYKDVGLVSQVFDEATLSSLTGHISIGHCRYGSYGANDWRFAQPTLGATADDGTVAMGLNGALTNREEIKALIAQRFGEVDYGELAQGNNSDTALITTLLHGQDTDALEDTAADVFALLKGAFSLVMMSENTLYAARDPHGFRPLVLGRLSSGWVVASEQAALATTGATFIREIAPGEMIAIDDHGVRSTRFAPSNLARRIRSEERPVG